MQGLAVLVDILVMLTNVLVMLIIVQFVIGLLFAFNVVSPSNEFLRQVYESINRLLEPVLRPIRNIMPNTGAIDFSPLVLILGLQILTRVMIGLAGAYCWPKRC
jgi:YggT family protein